MAQTKKKSEHYVNNKEFLAAMVEYKKSVNKAHREKKRKPEKRKENPKKTPGNPGFGPALLSDIASRFEGLCSPESM